MFPGYAGVWEQHKLSDVASITMGQSPDGSTYSTTPQGHILIQGNADLSHGWVSPRVWTTQVTKTCDAGDIIMSVRAPAGAIGRTQYNAVIGRGVAAIKGNDFIYQSLARMNDIGYWRSLVTGSTFESINSTDLKNADLCVPSLAEQRKIGSFFHKLDDLLALHQRQTQKLTELKQGLLQNMFPREGESVPRLRFPGFTTTWKQQKLGDIATIVGGGTPATTHSEYWNGTIDWYAPAEITNQRYVSHSQRQITQLGLEKSSAQLLPAHKTVLFTSRAGIGKMAILQREAATNQGFQSLVLHDGIDPYFIYSMNAILKKKAEKIAAGSTFLEISGSHLAHIRITIPSLSEQKQIGSFFRTLDDRIHCHEQYTVKLVELKKGLLQKMFPQD